jgi:hypothetical protein
MPRTKAPAKPTGAEPPASGPELVDQLLIQFRPKLAKGTWSGMAPDDVPAGKALLAADPATRAAAFGAVLDHLATWFREFRAYKASLRPGQTLSSSRAWVALDNRRCLLVDTLVHLRRHRLPLTDRTVAKFIERRIRENGHHFGAYTCHIEGVWDMVRPHVAANGVGPQLRKALMRLILNLRKTNFVNELKYADKFEQLLVGGSRARR